MVTVNSRQKIGLAIIGIALWFKSLFGKGK